MGQTQTTKPAARDSERASTAKPRDLSEKAEELKAKADDIIDEIDQALEEALGEGQTAESFVSAYVQRNGQLILLTLLSSKVIAALFYN